MTMTLSELDAAILRAHKEALRRLRTSEEHCDLILRCTNDGKEFNVHKAIVCAQSGFFQKACKPDSFKEGKDDVVELTIGSSATIALFLDFLYNMSYPNFEPDCGLVHDVNLYIAADFYDVPILKQTATTHFEQHVANLECVEASLVSALRIIYEDTANTDRTLRDPALAVVLERASDLLKPQGKDAGPATLTQLANAIPELGADITLSLVLEVEKLKSPTPTKPEANNNKERHYYTNVHCGCGSVHTDVRIVTDCWWRSGGSAL